MPRVEVPGMGLVEFPEGMSDVDMAAAIKKNMPAPQVTQSKQPGPFDFAGNIKTAASGGLEDIKRGISHEGLSGRIAGVLPKAPIDIAKGAYEIATSPITAASRAFGGAVEKGTGGLIPGEQAETALMGLAPGRGKLPSIPRTEPVVPKAVPERSLGAAGVQADVPPEVPLKQQVQRVSDDLHQVRQSGVADRAQIAEGLDKVPPQFRAPEVQEKWYHAIEDPKVASTMTPEEQAAFNQHIAPMRKELTQLYNKIKGLGGEVEDPNYVHRIAKGHAPQYDPISGDAYDPVTGTRSLKRTTSALQERKFFALEDAAGNRHVVSKGEGGTTLWTNGKPSKMTKELDLKPGSTVDLGGKPYYVKQARTSEIEANSDVRYYKNAAVNTADALVRMREVARNVEYLDKLKTEMQGANLASPIEQGKPPPRGFVETKIPQLRGMAFEPKIANALNDFYKPGLDGLEGLRKINQFATGSIFWNPIPHIENVAAHWFTGRGWDWIRPGPMKNFATDAGRAIRATVTQNKDYQDMLRSGSGLVYGGVKNADFYQAMAQKFGMEVEKNWGQFKSIFDKLGLKTPYEATAWWYRKMRETLWAANDMFMMHRVYELERKGLSRTHAIKEAEKHIPNYRIPPEVLGSRTFSRILQEPALTIFSRYHYGMWKSYMNMVADMAKGAPKEKVEALGNLAALGVLMYGVYPAVDYAIQSLTGDPKAKKLRRGSTSIVGGIQDMYQGDLTFPQFLANAITIAPATKEGMQQFIGKDWFTGQDIGGPVQRTEHAAGALVSPYATLNQLTDIREGSRTATRTLIDTLLGAKNVSERTERGRALAKKFRERAQAKRAARPRGLIERGAKAISDYAGTRNAE